MKTKLYKALVILLLNGLTKTYLFVKIYVACSNEKPKSQPKSLKLKKTMKRLIESTGFRKLVAPGPAWQSQIDLISDLPQIRNTFNGSGLVVTSACSSLGSMAGRSKRRLKR